MQKSLFLLTILSSFCGTHAKGLVASDKVKQPDFSQVKKVKVGRKIRWGGPQLKSKGFKDLSLDELLYNLEIFKMRDEDRTVLRYIEHIIPKLTDFEKIRDMRLELADLYFKFSQHEKSGSIYTEYCEAYPGHDRAEYALWQALQAKHKQIGACDQDNVVTDEVISLANKYLDNKSYNKYRKQVVALFTECRIQLVDSEIKVFEYYFKRSNMTAAQRRVDHIKKKYSSVAGAKQKIAKLDDLLAKVRAGKNPRRILAGGKLVEQKPGMLKKLFTKKKSNTEKDDISIKFAKAKKSYTDRF